MVRTGGVAWCRANAAILFLNQLFIREGFSRLIAAVFTSHFLMQVFSECFCQSISERLQENSVIIVQLLFKSFQMWFNTLDGNGECSNIVGVVTGISRFDEICETEVGLIGRFLYLLA